MEFFADLLIAAGALGVAIFCFVLSRRLKALGRLDSGIGGAIAVLAKQVDDLTRALKAAQATARDSATKLEDQTRRANAACRQLELLMASLHDLPSPETARRPKSAEPMRRPEAAFPSARPLSRWNTNRLRPEADDNARAVAQDEHDETDEAPEPAIDDTPRSAEISDRARTFEPEDEFAPRPRSRVIHRRRKISACA